jgi:hypothetical protein
LKKGPEIPPAALRAFKVPFFSPEGVLLRTESTAKWQLLAFWNDAPSAELLAETFRQQPGVHFAPRGEYAPANPSWEWPAGFDLNTARVLAQSKNLWILTPRKVWHHLGIEFKEPARFSDARQATLFYFTPGSRAPLAIPIAFESSAIEPFNPRQGGFDLMGFQPGRIAEAPFWLDTPAGLVFSAPTLGGHWLIPRPQLEQRVSVWRAKASTDGNPVNPFNAGINHEH